MSDTITTITLIVLTALALAASALAIAAMRRGEGAGSRLVHGQHVLTGLCIVGAALLFIYRAWFINRGWHPVGAHVDGLLLIVPLFAATVLFVQRAGMRGLSVFALPMLTVLLAWAICASVWTYQPFAVGSIWWAVHLASVYGGSVFFCIAAAAGCMYLYAQRRLRRHLASVQIEPIASLEAIEATIVRTATAGFALITVALASGAIIWTAPGAAHLEHGWWYAPKVVLATAAWLVYALLMNVRYATAFRGRRAAWMSILGLLLLVGTFGAVSALERTSAPAAPAVPEARP